MPRSTSHTNLVFITLLTAHTLAALYAPIQDCDETFNYWEPSHYLNHGYGMQTWEYSPVYAIRSWLYAAIHSSLISTFSLVIPSSKKPLEFFGLRCALGLVCALCETRLYAAISRTLNVRIGIIFVTVCASSAGMFHAAVSYLPSSFAMYTVSLASADFIDRSTEDKALSSLAWLALGTIVGWPFVAVLALPFVMEVILSGAIAGTLPSKIRMLVGELPSSLGILALETVVDSVFYRQVTSVPFNIVQYNVLSKSGGGPDIYGVEPWHFYIRNLLINFNFWFVLAMLSLPVLLLHRRPSVFRLKEPKVLSRILALMSLSYLWFAIFTFQPHKEERFMYPIYPCLAVNAAIALHLLIIEFSTGSPKSFIGRIPNTVKLLGISALFALFTLLGMWRSAGLASAYSAPLSIYRSLYDSSLVSSNPLEMYNVCVGKEWYRYPSSYHLPSNARLKFIKSEFRGLLPGEFAESSSADGFFPATRMIPSGMNDRNIEDPDKYTNLEHCHFLVDSSFPEQESSTLEPDFAKDETAWERVKCLRFLDPGRTSTLGRLFWIPDLGIVPAKFKRYWGEYCLLSRKLPKPT